jgi:hypothetical protein
MYPESRLVRPLEIQGIHEIHAPLTPENVNLFVSKESRGSCDLRAATRNSPAGRWKRAPDRR